MGTRSPEGPPPLALAIARDKCDKAQRISAELKEAFEAMSRQVEPDVEPDQEQPEQDRHASFRLASLGIEAVSKEQEALRSERDVVAEEKDAGLLDPETACERIRTLNQRYLSTGGELWRQQKKRMRLDDAGTLRPFEPRDKAISECLLALYRRSDGVDLDQRGKHPSRWRKDAIAYYKGGIDSAFDCLWCHITGKRWASNYVKAAHIVPFFLDSESIGEMLFGSRSESLTRAGNALLLSSQPKYWFDTYQLVIVPVNASESPITRWKTEIISSDIPNRICYAPYRGLELHGKELVFLNEKRPVTRFLYFHFIMALIRAKDLKRHKWEHVWARYYQERPFPAPGPYMRKSILVALATHFAIDDMSMVNSWLSENGFESPLRLADDEATEAARRVFVAVEGFTSRAERRRKREPEDTSEEDSSDKDNSEDSSGEENSDEENRSGED